MFNWLLKIYKHLLPERQLLIRQHGEVKYINITGPVQLVFLSIIIMLFTWVVYSSTKYFSLNEKVSATHHNLQQSKRDLGNLTNEYQEKQNELNKHLSQLQQQQTFLQNILDSLPQTIKPAKDQNEKLSNELKEKFKDINTSASISEKMQSTKEQLFQLSSAQKASFTRLTIQIQQRQNELDGALHATGISRELLSSLYKPKISAQGGPLYDLSMHATNKQKNLIDQLIELNELETELQNIPVSLPAKDFYISSLYGYRKDPLSKRRAMHKGIDMAGWIKTEIFSPASGKIKRAGKNGSYGNFIEIDHQNGFTTRYGHLYKIKVKSGQYINKNDIIGLMGSTGRSTSTHLHYEVMFNNKTINPLKITRALEDVL
ncbi:M23 family metallopeptidase [Pseudoalteromonas denitrificans]|uniref:Murein DD-endopeptidase MepM and murein hydrolase activator NlpD, contain LysM domain n=1 Tax=Pseudoalteromonas denitrificans DSM 6059 TaxID=1123010 RepID=A0A1I1MUR9_9GAMM|nr:M23 family metallopeptidase [Pseudoalteromonas denitrificans]SFC85330.1 Murein DD-endopeptidase MepM and murein hydrolase activator NlpD, contain LysM domain [Pseudoalteromonas denitrificans DSM 6059]